MLYYAGNYTTYVRTKAENEVNQMKAYQKQQDEIAHIKKFIASAGTYANLVKQAKSKQKVSTKPYPRLALMTHLVGLDHRQDGGCWSYRKDRSAENITIQL
jgi:ATPase subunit of ABC transporter with duplicated ATPase domains